MKFQEKLKNHRIQLGLTQEEVAEHCAVSLRTYQRFEKGESKPKSSVLLKLEEKLNFEETLNFEENKANLDILALLINIMKYGLLNLCMNALIGFLTLDSNANLNSKIGAILLSFFMPLTIVLLTKNISRNERFLKFGIGFMLYFITVCVVVPNGFNTGWVSFLFPSLIIATLTFLINNE